MLVGLGKSSASCVPPVSLGCGEKSPRPAAESEGEVTWDGGDESVVSNQCLCYAAF